MHRMITMHVRLRQTDRQTDGRTDQHHGNSATIRSTNASRAKNGWKTDKKLNEPDHYSSKLFVMEHGRCSLTLLQHAAKLRAVLAMSFLSVRPSVTGRYCVRTNKLRMMSSLQLGGAMYLVFGDIWQGVSECECVGFNERPTRHIIGHFGDDFYRPDDQTNSVKALKETSWSSKIRLESHQNHSTMFQ